MTRLKDLVFLVAFTLAALFIHGYHPAAEDAAIYLSAIKKDLNGHLYPFGSEFFMSHARLTWFDELIAGSVKLTHIRLESMLLSWHLLSVFLLLLACLLISEAVFGKGSQRWSAVAIVTAVLTVPVAGTSLLLMDPYLTPRSLSTPLVLFALTATLSRRYLLAVLYLLAIAPIHPLMTLYGAALCSTLLLLRLNAFVRIWRWLRRNSWLPSAEDDLGARGAWAAAIVFPVSLMFLYEGLPSVSPAYRAALATRSYFFLENWAWYEWIGLVAPLALMYLWARSEKKNPISVLPDLVKALLIFGCTSIAVGLLFSSSSRFDSLAELQPLRAFHSIYIVFFVLLGGMLGSFLLRRSFTRHALLLGPVCLCMFLVQRATFPADRHIEWPWLANSNSWLEAFVWIRENTPTAAIVALRPDHMNVDGEDNQGFRAVAERSMLADSCKDAGVVTMFPNLATEWQRQTSALRGWSRFTLLDFKKLSRLYGVSWLVLEKPVAGLVCPYRNRVVSVCRIPGS